MKIIKKFKFSLFFLITLFLSIFFASCSVNKNLNFYKDFVNSFKSLKLFEKNYTSISREIQAFNEKKKFVDWKISDLNANKTIVYDLEINNSDNKINGWNLNYFNKENGITCENKQNEIYFHYDNKKFSINNTVFVSNFNINFWKKNEKNFYTSFKNISVFYALKNKNIGKNFNLEPVKNLNNYQINVTNIVPDNIHLLLNGDNGFNTNKNDLGIPQTYGKNFYFNWSSQKEKIEWQKDKIYSGLSKIFNLQNNSTFYNKSQKTLNVKCNFIATSFGIYAKLSDKVVMVNIDGIVNIDSKNLGVNSIYISNMDI